MPWPAFFFLVSVIGLAIASYTDLRERIVSNKLSYPLIAIGIGGYALVAILEANPMPLLNSVIATAGGFAFAYALWKMGVWAGGDVKLLTGIAALNPMNLNILAAFGISLWGLNQSIALPIFFLSMFVFSVLAMLPYGLLIALHGLAKRREERKMLVQDSLQKAKQTVQLVMAVAGISWLLTLFGITQWAVLPILVALGLVKSARARIPLIGGVFGASVFFSPLESVESAAMLFAIFFGLYLLLKLYAVSKNLLRETKKITELEEGEIIAESFFEHNGKVQRMAQLETKRIINYLAANKLQELLEYLRPSGREIASSRKARGVTEEEIEELKTLVKEKKVEDRIEIKLSAPFVPAMLIAYLALNIVGDALWVVTLSL